MHILEKMAQNPHYKMTPKQLAELEDLRRSRPVQHTTSIPKHDTAVRKHNTKPEKEDGPARRDSTHQSSNQA